MLAMCAELKAARAARDWERVGRVVDALPARLAAWAAAGALRPAEQRALTQLRAAHDVAARACGGAAREIAARLDEIHNNKEGWMAYALDEVSAPAGEAP